MDNLTNKPEQISTQTTLSQLTEQEEQTVREYLEMYSDYSVGIKKLLKTANGTIYAIHYTGDIFVFDLELGVITRSNSYPQSVGKIAMELKNKYNNSQRENRDIDNEFIGQLIHRRNLLKYYSDMDIKDYEDLPYQFDDWKDEKYKAFSPKTKWESNKKKQVGLLNYLIMRSKSFSTNNSMSVDAFFEKMRDELDTMRKEGKDIRDYSKCSIVQAINVDKNFVHVCDEVHTPFGFKPQVSWVYTNYESSYDSIANRQELPPSRIKIIQECVDSNTLELFDPNIILAFNKMDGMNDQVFQYAMQEYADLLRGKPSNIQVGYDLRDIYEKNRTIQEIQQMKKIAKATHGYILQDSLPKRVWGFIKKRLEPKPKQLKESRIAVDNPRKPKTNQLRDYVKTDVKGRPNIQHKTSRPTKINAEERKRTRRQLNAKMDAKILVQN